MRPLALLLVMFAAAPATGQSTTSMVVDLFPGSEGAEPWWFTAVDGSLYFVADDGVHGREIWRLDGGTPVLAIDLWPGSASSDPRMRVVDGTVYVGGNDGAGRRIWRMDGSALVPLHGSHGVELGGWSTPSGCSATINGATVIQAATPVHGAEPWVIRGDSMRLLADLDAGPLASWPGLFCETGGLVYFMAWSGAFVTDGVAVWPAPGPGPYQYVAGIFGGRAIGRAWTESTGGELWVVDGENWTPMPEAYPGPEGLGCNAYCSILEFDSLLFVQDADQERGDRLWSVQDGEWTGYVQLAPARPGDGFGFTVVRAPIAGSMFVEVYRTTSGGRRGELLRGDGFQFKVIHEFGTVDDPIWSFAGLEDRGYYTVQDIDFGFEVFEVFGDSVRLVLPEVLPGPWGGVRSEFVVHEGRAYFAGNDLVYGTELWVTTPPPVATDQPPQVASGIRRISPNPTPATLNVDLALDSAGLTDLEVFDAIGRRVLSHALGLLAAGRHSITLDVGGLGPGAYALLIRGPASPATARFVVAPR